MKKIFALLVVSLSALTASAQTEKRPDDCSTRWHQNYIQAFSDTLDIDGWKCFREDKNKVSEGRYLRRTGSNHSDGVYVWYFDDDLYGNWIFRRGLFDSEFRAIFMNRNWDVRNVSYPGWDAFLCFEARSVRKASYQTLRYCSARRLLDQNGPTEFYDREMVENIFENGGTFQH